MLKILAILMFGFTFACHAAEAQATVSGVVLDSRGNPVLGSSVEAFPTEIGGFVGNLSWTKVGDHGDFRLILPQGHYEIRAKAEAQGYPDPNALLSIDPHAIFPEISVGKEDIERVQVRLGSQGGILEGEVRDRLSRAPVHDAKITIRDVEKSEAFVEVFSDKTGHFTFALPGKRLSISATASGYKRAEPPGGKEIMLAGGEHRVVVFELEHR